MNILRRMDISCTSYSYAGSTSSEECLRGSKLLDVRLLNINFHYHELSHSKYSRPPLGHIIAASAEGQPESPHAGPCIVRSPQRSTSTYARSSSAPGSCATSGMHGTSSCSN